MYPNLYQSALKAVIRTASGTRALSVVLYSDISNKFELAIIDQNGELCKDKESRAVFAKYPESKKYYGVLDGMTNKDILQIIEQL